MTSYYEYKETYPETLALIEDCFYGLGAKESSLDQDDKCRIVAKLAADCGDDLDIRAHKDFNTRLELFIRHGDEVSCNIFRSTITESVYKTYEDHIRGMFDAIERERMREFREIRGRYYTPVEQYLDERDRARDINRAGL